MEFSGSAKQPLQALKRLKNAQASQSVAVGHGARPVGLPPARHHPFLVPVFPLG